MFQIGSGYFGMSAGSVKPTKVVRQQVKSAFDRAFAIPAKELNVKAAQKPKAARPTTPVPEVAKP